MQPQVYMRWGVSRVWPLYPMTAQLFGVPVSPYVLIARAGLEILGVDYELVFVPPHGDNPDFVKASPNGKIPAVTDGDFSIDDSTAIVAYFDVKLHAVDGKSIFGGTPQARARIVKLEKYLQIDGFDIANRFLRHIRLNGNPDEFPQILADASKVLDYLETEIQENGYFVGSSYSAADTALFARLVTYHIAGQKLDESKYPKLVNAYRQALKNEKLQTLQAEAEAQAQHLINQAKP